MGKTKRNASRWMETRFKYNDPMYPDPEFSDRRFQEKTRNGNSSYYCEKLNPLTMKTLNWAGYGPWSKVHAKRVARHQAKIMVIHEILRQHRIDEAQDYSDMMWEMCDDYQDDYMGFDFSWPAIARPMPKATTSRAAG